MNIWGRGRGEKRGEGRRADTCDLRSSKLFSGTIVSEAVELEDGMPGLLRTLSQVVSPFCVSLTWHRH